MQPTAKQMSLANLKLCFWVENKKPQNHLMLLWLLVVVLFFCTLFFLSNPRHNTSGGCVYHGWEFLSESTSALASRICKRINSFHFQHRLPQALCWLSLLLSLSVVRATFLSHGHHKVKRIHIFSLIFATAFWVKAFPQFNSTHKVWFSRKFAVRCPCLEAHLCVRMCGCADICI